MASFGANYIRVAPFTGEEPAAALPTYAAPVSLGKLVKADLSIKWADAELHADNLLVESLHEFASATLAVETDDVLDTVSSAIFGAKVDTNKELVDGGNDTAPYLGIGYYKDIVRKGVKSCKCVFYPKAMAQLGNDNAATKGSSLTLATTPTTFTIFQPNTGNWRYRMEFTGATAAEDAKKWIDGKLGVVTPPPPAKSAQEPAAPEAGPQKARA